MRDCWRLPEIPVVGPQDVDAEEEVDDGMGNDASAEAAGADEKQADHRGPDECGDPLDVNRRESHGDDQEGGPFEFADCRQMKIIGGQNRSPEEIAPET